ncbi:MAG: potassium transporter Kup [Paracoccaceae bacterium]
MSETDAATSDSAQEQGQAHGHSGGNIALLVLGAIGVVYGDIGTSPLYAMRESLHAASHDGLTESDVFGVISLLIWTLILIVTVKYVMFIMRADNRGEGGTLSLVALVQKALRARPAWLLGVGVIGISLFFGDAIITPAMSVLSAVEGMSLVAPGFSPFVIPATLVIIVALFAVQAQGTGTVSILFGPIMVIWFLVMAIMGIAHIGDDPRIFAALNPIYAAGFLVHNGLASFIVLGSVFLAVTGGEALYADMGHFGRKPIRIAWGILVFPALTLSYLGQGALVLAHPEKAENPFFLMAPDWMLLPLVILATAATVIASQAVISGAFSMIQQAVRMGLLPRMEILHTSETQYGQIYLPKINMVLAVGVVTLVLIFGSSSNLASAYGIAVTGDMVITSILAFFVFTRAWKWSKAKTLSILLPIFIIECLFLAANMTKVMDGGYVPIIMAAVVCLLMWTWVRGSRHVQRKARQGAIDMESLIGMLKKSKPLEAPGTAVFLTSDPDMAPTALLHNLKHNHVLHSKNFIVTVSVVPTPYLTEDHDRITLEKLSDRFVRVGLNFGYMEEPNVPKALALARKEGEKFDIMSTTFFLNRRSFRSSPQHGLPRWQESLFISMTKSAADATGFYRLPTNRVVELGQQLMI